MKISEKLAKFGHDKMFGSRCEIRPGIRYFTEKDFKGLIKDDFEIKNDNGFILRGGYYHYSDYDKDTLIILCHGMGGGHQAYMKEIEYLARNNFKVLAIDYQGTILSEGDKINGCTQALIDMDKVVKQVKNDYQNIYVIGHSWGGWVAQGLCDLNPEISKLCTLAGMASLTSLVKQYFPWYISFLKKPVMNIEYNIGHDLAYSNAINTLNNRKDLSALLIQSTDDKMLTYSFHLGDIKNHIQRDNVKYIVVSNRNHNPNYTNECVKNLGQYLHKALKIKDPIKAEKLADSVDWNKLCELDENIMNQIVQFFQK